MATRYILSIDGGGIRGVIPARILAELERRRAAAGKTAPLAHAFDMIAGTSTGGIIAIGLATPDAAGKPVANASALEALYADKGIDIFPQTVFQKLRSLASVLEWPKYSPDNLEHILKGMLGEARLSAALTKVLIPTYDLAARAAVFMTNSFPSDRDFLAREAARGTSAAPTFFPPALIRAYGGPTDAAFKEIGVVDGGVFANDPTIAAYTEATKLKRHGIWGADDDVTVISIGTGLSARAIPYSKAKNWGVTDWINPRDDTPIISILTQGQQSTVSYQMNALLNGAGVTMPGGIATVPADAAALAGERYFRFNIKLDGKLPVTVNDEMDDASKPNITGLKAAADVVIKAQTDQLDEIVRRLP